ncbi:HGxxPAAW family protein [Streptomyces sp. NPDC059740]|uniref:HGxxPAAW family protein n=1 Tax=Streptomyces sp. NPDC059740 TaxID=3346926 RepID=UPI00365219AD
MSSSGHGHTPAAWTGVIISFIGFCVAGVCTVLAVVPGFWAGLAIVAVGAVVGGAMKMAGLGQKHELPSAEVAQRARQAQPQRG